MRERENSKKRVFAAIEGWRDDEDAAKEAVGGGNGKSVVSKGMGWTAAGAVRGITQLVGVVAGGDSAVGPLVRGLECFYQNCFQFSSSSVV